MSRPQGRGGGLDQPFRMFLRMQENFGFVMRVIA
jgi:hypothetical protein